MRAICRAALLLAGAAGAPAPVLAESPPLEPYQMVRSLQLVQDRIAVGDHAAMPMQRKLLEMIDKQLRTATAAGLMQPLNMRSMMVYAMSGGNPETLRAVTRRMHVEERDGKLTAGILAYLNGATKTASLTLKDAEPMTEPIEIGAFLALIKGSVIALEDPKSALKLFDQARLLSPGTLVEEAALRRSVALAATMHDAARFPRLADQYVRAYLRSPYASQFADAFVSGVLALHDTVDLNEVDAIVAMMNAEQRKVIYLRIARRAAIDGLVALSHYASGKADEISGPDGEAGDPRVLLYTSLTDITTAPVAEIRDRLDRIDRARLSAGDRKLLDAVMAVNTAIMREPPEEAPGAAADPAPPAGARPATAETAVMPGGPEAAADPDMAPLPETAAPAAGGEPPAPMAEIPPAAVAPASAKPGEPADPSDALIAAGRRKLAEIDDLLAGAAE